MNPRGAWEGCGTLLRFVGEQREAQRGSVSFYWAHTGSQLSFGLRPASLVASTCILSQSWLCLCSPPALQDSPHQQWPLVPSTRRWPGARRFLGLAGFQGGEDSNVRTSSPRGDGGPTGWEPCANAASCRGGLGLGSKSLYREAIPFL